MQLGSKTFAGTFSYYSDGSRANPVSYLYAQDLNKDGVDEVLFVAFETQPNTPSQYSNTSVHIFGWHDGTFKEVTQQWLPGDSNRVEGVGDVAFGDFNGDGLKDAFLSAYTDMDFAVNAYVLYNTGASFNKVSMGMQTWQHSVRSYDINQDGYDDVIPVGYADMPRYMGSANGLVKFSGFTGGSGLALGDFMKTGKASVIFVDAGGGLNDTYLYNFDFSTPGFVIAERVSQLPGPRLESMVPTASSHDIRAVPFDFNDDGLLDVIVISYGYGLSDAAVHRSEVQFLLNKSSGVFEDVTSTYRIGFDVSGNVGYTPQLIDINQDGRLDLFLSQPDWLPKYNSTTLLIQQQDKTFVDTARALLTSAINSGGGQGVLVQGPNKSMYLVTEGAWDWSNPQTKVYSQKIIFPERELPEILTGTLQDDTIMGFGGDDKLQGNSGNDALDGGDGQDTAVYALNASSYTVTAITGGYQVVAKSGTEGTDTLLNVERLKFANKTVGAADFVAAGGESLAEPKFWKDSTKAPTDTKKADAVNLTDAIAILKMIVGLNVNSNNTPLSPYQAIAADFDQSGDVGLTDAIGVLKMVVGLSAPAPAWKYYDDTKLASAYTSAQSLNPKGWTTTAVISDVGSADSSVKLIGVLTGDVDGSWTGV